MKRTLYSENVFRYQTHCRDHENLAQAVQNQETTRRMKICATCKTHATIGISITINSEMLRTEA